MKKEKLYGELDFVNYVTEANGSVGDLGELPKNVLSVVSGPAFVPDGYSRNGRFYPKELWENVLKNKKTKETLERKLMFGCIGHPVGQYSLDELLESGKVSHIVTKIEIKDGKGIAEYHILDTPSGRILNSVLNAGSKLYVSTRAFGGFSSEVMKHEGREYKVLDKDNFVIESIDFVINPGFLEADPSLAESFKDDLMMMAEDKNEIKCTDGLCSLAETLFENEKMKEKTNESIEKDKNTTSISDIIEDMDKEQIVSMITSIVDENTSLIEKYNTIDTNSDDSEENLKKLKEIEKLIKFNAEITKHKIFISYMEILYKLIRFDTSNENLAKLLIEILDGDKQLSSEEITKVKDSVSKLNTTGSSAIDTVVKKLINIDMSNHVDGDEDDSTEDDKNDNVTEMLTDLTSVVSLVLSEFSEQIIESKGFVESHKNSTKIIEQLKTTIDGLTANFVAYQKEMDIKDTNFDELEKLHRKELKSKEDTIKELNLTIMENEKTSKKFGEAIDETYDKYNNILEKFETVSNEKNELEISHKNLVKKLKQLEEHNTKIIEELELEHESTVNSNNETVRKLENKVKELKVTNYTMLYPNLEKYIIEEMIDKHSDDNDLNNALQEKNKRHVSRYTAVNDLNGVVIENKAITSSKSKSILSELM